MEITDLLNAISTVGFPIFATCGLGYLLYKEQQAHKEEMNSLKDALERNTVVISEFKQLMEDIRKDG